MRAEPRHSSTNESGLYCIVQSRYTAVCHPLYYRDTILGRRLGYRVMNYFLPVIVLSTLINIPKFLEVEVVYQTYLTEDNVTSLQNISYEFTDLRMDPDYIR